MKKILCLILCLPLLLLGGCKEEEQGAPTPFYGSFYKNDGLRQNTAVTMTVETVPLTTPATALRATLYNNTDYLIECNINDRMVEVYVDGTWQAPPASVTNTVRDGSRDANIEAHGINRITMEFSLHASGDGYNSDGKAPLQYSPLDAGYYRLRLPNCRVKGIPEEEAKNNPFEIVTYFAVGGYPPDVAPDADYIVGGITQNPYVHLSAIQSTGNSMTYRVVNTSDTKLYVLFSQMHLQIYDAEQNLFKTSTLQPVATYVGADADFPLPAGEDIQETLHVAPNADATSTMLPAGLYRLRLPCRFEGQTASFTLLSDFIVTASAESTP